MIRFLILAGYFELTMYLQLSGKLNQLQADYEVDGYIKNMLKQIITKEPF